MGKQWVVAYGRADLAVGPFDDEVYAETVNNAIGGDGVVELVSCSTFAMGQIDKLTAALLGSPTGRIATEHVPPLHNLPATTTERIPSAAPNTSNTPKPDVPPWEA